MAKSKGHKDISIIIVNFKSWIHLENCLNSLKFTSESFSYEVLVVDNQSNDGGLDDFKQKFDWVQFIENSGNNGFANGCNYGASLAKGDYLMFLNPDTIANPEAVSKIWQYAKQHPTSGIVSCKQKRPSGTYEKSHREFPSLFTLFGLLRAIAKLLTSNKPFTEDNVLFTGWVSGSLVFMSRDWFDQIQGWNEDYWMYFEDMDLSKRVHDSNGKVTILEDIEIIHNHGGSSRINMKTASLTKTESQISKHVYIVNHFKGIEQFLSLTVLVTYNIFIKFIFAIFGLIFFFIPKMRLNVYLWAKIVRYYFRSLIKGTWLSPNSMNYNKA